MGEAARGVADNLRYAAALDPVQQGETYPLWARMARAVTGSLGNKPLEAIKALWITPCSILLLWRPKFFPQQFVPVLVKVSGCKVCLDLREMGVKGKAVFQSLQQGAGPAWQAVGKIRRIADFFLTAVDVTKLFDGRVLSGTQQTLISSVAGIVVSAVSLGEIRIELLQELARLQDKSGSMDGYRLSKIAIAFAMNAFFLTFGILSLRGLSSSGTAKNYNLLGSACKVAAFLHQQFDEQNRIKLRA